MSCCIRDRCCGCRTLRVSCLALCRAVTRRHLRGARRCWTICGRAVGHGRMRIALLLYSALPILAFSLFLRPRPPSSSLVVAHARARQQHSRGARQGRYWPFSGPLDVRVATVDAPRRTSRSCRWICCCCSSCYALIVLSESDEGGRPTRRARSRWVPYQSNKLARGCTAGLLLPAIPNERVSLQQATSSRYHAIPSTTAGPLCRVDSTAINGARFMAPPRRPSRYPQRWHCTAAETH